MGGLWHCFTHITENESTPAHVGERGTDMFACALAPTSMVKARGGFSEEKTVLMRLKEAPHGGSQVREEEVLPGQSAEAGGQGHRLISALGKRTPTYPLQQTCLPPVGAHRHPSECPSRDHVQRLQAKGCHFNSSIHTAEAIQEGWRKCWEINKSRMEAGSPPLAKRGKGVRARKTHQLPSLTEVRTWIWSLWVEEWTWQSQFYLTRANPAADWQPGLVDQGVHHFLQSPWENDDQ